MQDNKVMGSLFASELLHYSLHRNGLVRSIESRQVCGVIEDLFVKELSDKVAVNICEVGILGRPLPKHPD